MLRVRELVNHLKDLRDQDAVVLIGEGTESAAHRRLSAINRTITLTYRFLPLRADVGAA